MAAQPHDRVSSGELWAGLRWALVYFLLAANSCVDATFEFAPWREASSKKALPEGACYWQQGSLINHIPTGPASPGCKFEVRDAEFLEVLGSSPQLKVLVDTDAHEGGVYYPDEDEFFFSTGRSTARNGQQVGELKKLHIETTQLSTVNAQSAVPNGMVLDNEGNLLVCQQGSKVLGGFIQRVNLKTLQATVVADNWFGVPFNSPNDVVVKTDGSIWFTDPSYGSVQGFRLAPKVNNQLYRISPSSGVVDAVADGFVQPNGLAFSEDEKRLYVTDTGFAIGLQGQFDVTRPHSVYVFDVESDGLLGNRRLFAAVGVYDGSSPGLGIPDGIKVDTKGRVYVGTVDGVQVFSRSGKALGLIRQRGVSNMGFGGKHLDTLFILNNTAISTIKLQVKGGGLKYATKFK